MIKDPCFFENMFGGVFIYYIVYGFFWWGCQKNDGLTRTKREQKKVKQNLVNNLTCQNFDAWKRTKREHQICQVINLTLRLPYIIKQRLTSHPPSNKFSHA